MKTNFLAYRVHQQDKATSSRLEQITLDDVNDGEVVIKAAWSTVNYKDALATTGAGRIMRRFPMVAGIDVSGVVETSSDSRFKIGDKVLVTGCDLGEGFDGGFSEYVRVAADSVIPLPTDMTLRDAMAIGTAGFTAALAVHQMQKNDQAPDNGVIAVTGPTGGVGSVAINILSANGYQVAAITGKPDEADYLTDIGATEIIDRNELEMGTRPLEKTRFGGAIDNLGGEVLSWLSRTVNPWGNVAVIGLAADHKLETSVMPLILRGVNLLGIHSVVMPRELREKVWQRLSSDLKPTHLDKLVSREVDLENLPPIMQGYVDGKVTGRTVVKISGDL